MARDPLGMLHQELAEGTAPPEPADAPHPDAPSPPSAEDIGHMNPLFQNLYATNN